MRKIAILAVCGVAVVTGSVFPQPRWGDIEAFREELLQRLEQFRSAKQREMVEFRDSLNEAYARFLEEKWESFNLYREERGFRPMPKPPVYDPSLPQPGDEPPTVVVDVPPVPAADTVPMPDFKPVNPEPKATVTAEFFGTQVRLQQVEKTHIGRLVGVSESNVADFWGKLSKLPVETIASDLQRTGSALRLNDYGLFLLARELAATYIPGASENERVVFSAFMLNQVGLSAKIGRSGGDLYALLAARQELSNTSYFTFRGSNADPGRRYYVINLRHSRLTEIQTCAAQYGDGGTPLDFAVTATPQLAYAAGSQQLQFGGTGYVVGYNRNLVNYFSSYPCVDFGIYGTAPVDSRMIGDLRRQLSPHIAGKPQDEAVNHLLHFVQNAFRYKTDQDQYGYEKWNFAEETLVSAYCDCDDRAIFFAQLVRNLLGLETVLVNYPGIHLAAAVRFTDGSLTGGTYVTVDGSRFYICDPTYINADAGMAMPGVGDTVEIVEL